MAGHRCAAAAAATPVHYASAPAASTQRMRGCRHTAGSPCRAPRYEQTQRQGLCTHLDAFRLVCRRCCVQQAAAALDWINSVHIAAGSVQPVDQRAQGACTLGPGQGRTAAQSAGQRRRARLQCKAPAGATTGLFSTRSGSLARLGGRAAAGERPAAGPDRGAPAWQSAQGSRTSLLETQPMCVVV